MPNKRRQGNRPDRRVAPVGFMDDVTRNALLAKIRYAGSANHKLRPGDYGFVPSHNPRPSKSVCDDLRSILINEATDLFKEGIRRGMVSQFLERSTPKYVWAVDVDGEAYEAKAKPGRGLEYHGYRLGEDDSLMRKYVQDEWNNRCP